MKKVAAVDARPKVPVIATGVGYYNGVMYQPGDTFSVDAHFFDEKPRMVKGVDNVTRQDGVYDPPSWFEEAVVEEVAPTSRTVAKSTKSTTKTDDIG